MGGAIIAAEQGRQVDDPLLFQAWICSRRLGRGGHGPWFFFRRACAVGYAYACGVVVSTCGSRFEGPCVQCEWEGDPGIETSAGDLLGVATGGCRVAARTCPVSVCYAVKCRLRRTKLRTARVLTWNMNGSAWPAGWC